MYYQGWMLAGRGEGLVTVSPAYGPDCKCQKWKVGAESNEFNGDNQVALSRLIDLIDKDTQIFGDNSQKAKEMFQKMLQIDNSKLICGKTVEPKTKS